MKNIKGMTFITVIVISVVMIFIAVSASNMLLQDAHMINHLKYSLQAQYLAEAGISAAIAVLLESGFAAKDNPANFPQTSLGVGYYDVTVMEYDDRVILSSEGVIEGISQIAMVEVNDSAMPAMNNALSASNDIEIKSVKGDAIIKGDIHANDNLYLREQGTPTLIQVLAYMEATGKATSCNGYQTEGNVYVQDAANSGAGRPALPLPNFDFLYMKYIASTEGTYYGSDKNFNNETITGGTAGITYVNGAVQFSGDCTIIGGFVAANNIRLNNGNSITQVHDDGNRFPIFMTENSMRMYGRFNTVEGNIVYATNDITINTPGGTSAVLGTVLAGNSFEIVANNEVILTYEKVVAMEVTSGEITIVSWNR